MAQSLPTSHKRIRARTKVAVQSTQSTPYDLEESVLMEIRLRETFSGDLEGESLVRALKIVFKDQSASLVSMQRFCGTLAGRKGTFVLQGQERVEAGKITATWFVVSGSATGELCGLRGEGGFEGIYGKASEGTLEYWFE